MQPGAAGQLGAPSDPTSGGVLAFALDPGRARALSATYAKRGRRRRVLANILLLLAAHFVLWVLVGGTGSPGRSFDAFVFFGRIMLLVLLPFAVGYSSLRAARAHEAIAERLDLFGLLLGRRGTLAVDALATVTPWPAASCRRALDLAVSDGAASLVRTDALPLPPSSALDRARLVERHGAALRRAWWAALGALLCFGFASWWVLIVAIGLIKGEILIALAMGAFAIGVPASLGVFALRAARASRARATRLSRLSALVSAHDVRGFDQLAEWLREPPDAARASALEARTLGVLTEEGLAALAEGSTPATAPTRTLRARRRAPVASVSSIEELLGRTIDERWQVEALLGHGGMGAVFRVRDLQGGPPRALKVILPDVAHEPSFRARFAREIEAARRIDHPGIVRVHAHGAIGADAAGNALAWLVMDLLEGETLEQRLERRGQLPWREARAIAHQIGEALAAAHEAGLLHRDVKPGNVFLARDPRDPRGERAILLDFGLAAPIAPEGARITSTGAAIGTPLYMSPEQARGDALDARSDLHALATLLHEMLTGVPPFFDRNAATIYARLLAGDAPRLSQVAPSVAPSQLDPELTRALAREPRDRHPDVRAFLTALDAIA